MIFAGGGRGRNQSGIYTPTLTNDTNLSASTPSAANYSRSGDTVTVSGEVQVDPINTTTLTRLGISLPISSVFASAQDCGGVAAASAVSGQSARIYADVTNQRAVIEWLSVDVANRIMSFIFMYRVIVITTSTVDLTRSDIDLSRSDITLDTTTA